MFNRKPKVKLSAIHEQKLELIVFRTGLHVDTILSSILTEGLDRWVKNTNPRRPEMPPAPPTKLIDGSELHHNSDIKTPPGKVGYW